ncbi:TonB-dependent receptor [Aureibacter tunicatorum]|nr:TonB-dependent receptor [Aureibacter tunicatorum]
MRRTVFIIFFTLLLSLHGYAQNQALESLSLSGKFHNQSLISVLNELHQDKGINFAYNDDRLEGIIIDKDIPKTNLENFLYTLLENTDLTFLIIDDTIIIKDSSLGPFKINGKVVEASSQEALPFATLYLADKSEGTTTNQDGFFSFAGVPNDTATFFVKYVGYKTEKVRLNPGKVKQFLVVPLEKESRVLNEIVVNDVADVILENTPVVGLQNISAPQLEVLPTLAGGDVFRSMQYLPGVDATNNSGGGLSIRGSLPDQCLVLYDGATIYNMDHFFGLFSAFNPEAIKNIQIMKGGFDAKYGGRVAGVINMSGKSGNAYEPHASIGMNFLNAHGVFESPLGKKATVFVAARRTYSDLINNPTFDKILEESGRFDDNTRIEGNDVTNNYDYYFYDIMGKVTYRPSSKDMISFSTYTTTDKYNSQQLITNDTIRFFEESSSQIKWRNIGLSGQWGRQWTPNYYSHLIFSYSSYFNKLDHSYALDLDNEVIDQEDIALSFSQDNSVRSRNMKFDNEYTFNDKHRLDFGIEIENINIFLHQEFITSNVRNDDIDNLISLYVKDTYTPNEKLSLTYGLRTMYSENIKRNYYDPRFSFSYLFNKKLRLKGAWGIYHQAISRGIREVFYSNNPDFWVLSNGMDIPVSNSTHYMLGLNYQWKGFDFDMEAYYKDTRNLLEYVPRTINSIPQEGIPYDYLYFVGDNTVKGIDFTVKKDLGLYSGWLTYTLSEVLSKIPELNEGKPFPAQQDQRHQFKSVNIFKIKNFDIGLTWIYSSGKPYTEPKISYRLHDVDEMNIEFIDLSEVNNRRLPAYHRLDMSIAYEFGMGKKTKAVIGVELYNIYNRRNILFREFRYDEISPYEVEKKQYDRTSISFTPSLFFKVSF